jgi:hypothetical protein
MKLLEEQEEQEGQIEMRKLRKRQLLLEVQEVQHGQREMKRWRMRKLLQK